MPNAKDKLPEIRRAFLALGKAGSGKTSQFLTLPGKKFAYLFDPNALASLTGHDVDYEEFLPTELKLGLTSLSKEGIKREATKKPTNKFIGAELYRAWEADYEAKLDGGFFTDYDCIMFDSFTTLSDMVMDGILALNGRAGQWPQQDDYGPQMLSLTKIVRSLTALNKIVYMTGHLELRQDSTTKRIVNEPIMTGRLKAKLPLLFSELLVFAAQGDGKGKVNFTVQTRPDRYNENCRSSLKTVSPIEDITVDWSKSPIGQGLGELYKDALK